MLLVRITYNTFVHITRRPCRTKSNLTRAARPDNHLKTKLDIASLDRTVEKYFHRGLAPSSHRSYDSAKRRLLTFCNNTKQNPLPVSESLLSYIFLLCTIFRLKWVCQIQKMPIRQDQNRFLRESKENMQKRAQVERNNFQKLQTAYCR